jgi:carboxypeptidase Taq
VSARKASDFSQFAPVLTQWLDLTREKCAAIAPGAPVYDTALEPFERGMTSARLDAIFAEVRDGLVPLLAAVKARGTPPDDSWLRGEFDVDKQAALCREIAVLMGFDLERGRLDVSVHPFTGGAGPSDVRMTTRFKANDLTEGAWCPRHRGYRSPPADMRAINALQASRAPSTRRGTRCMSRGGWAGPTRACL